MEKLSRFLKNTLLFLAVFLVINFILNSFFSDEDALQVASGNLNFITTDTEYSRRQTVNVQLQNGTEQTITIPNECPGEPFTVVRYENNEWVQKSVSPEIECSDVNEIVIEPGEEITIPYDKWNFALFSEMGRFKIEFTTEIDGEEKTITTNEFQIVEEGLIRKLAVGVFYRPIYNGLIFLTAYLPGHSLGLAIIILTLIIRTILLVPNQKALRAQKKMQDIQPRLEKIKEKHKGDQQRIAMETMALWKEAKVSPAGSCLPMLLQFPFLIAIFYVTRDALNPDTANLLYSTYNNFSLTSTNHFFLGLDLAKNNIYVLPLIIGGLQFIQVRLTMARKNKKKSDDKDSKQAQMAMASNMMMYIMPVMIAVFTATLPAGVGIYWGTSTIYGIIQQLVINKTPGKKGDDEPKVRVISPSDS